MPDRDETTAAAPDGAQVPLAGDPEAQEPAPSGRPRARERGRMRRRLRRQKRMREALLLDLGALVYELHRHGRREPELLQAKAAELSAVDQEVRALADALEADESMLAIVAAGIAGSCENCGSLLSTDARYCGACGAPAVPALDASADRPGPALAQPSGWDDAPAEPNGLTASIESEGGAWTEDGQESAYVTAEEPAWDEPVAPEDEAPDLAEPPAGEEPVENQEPAEDEEPAEDQEPFEDPDAFDDPETFEDEQTADQVALADDEPLAPWLAADEDADESPGGGAG